MLAECVKERMAHLPLLGLLLLIASIVSQPPQLSNWIFVASSSNQVELGNWGWKWEMRQVFFSRPNDMKYYYTQVDQKSNWETQVKSRTLLFFFFLAFSRFYWPGRMCVCLCVFVCICYCFLARCYVA